MDSRRLVSARLCPKAGCSAGVMWGCGGGDAVDPCGRRFLSEPLGVFGAGGLEQFGLRRAKSFSSGTAPTRIQRK